MLILAWTLVAASALLHLYAYVGYPAALRILASLRGRREAPPALAELPAISITVPVYNEEAQIRDKLESLLSLDYPPERRQILVVSDASSDATDAIVREFASRGVEHLRLARRSGKGTAENFARPYLRGDIVINTDASTRIERGALQRLIEAFADPTVGVASGRDVSVANRERDPNAGESTYVGYEMAVRELETRVFGVVGASGCFYAIRAHLHRAFLPDSLSRDFAAAVIAREHGYRAVSVPQAICLVPRTGSLQREYRRKVRTMARGMLTLWYMRHLLNPRRYGLFAWMLFSHKVCRWVAPATLPLALFGLALAARTVAAAGWLLGTACLVVGVSAIGWRVSDRAPLPTFLSVPAYLLAGNVAAIHAALRAWSGQEHSIWEPTRREVIVVR